MSYHAVDAYSIVTLPVALSETVEFPAGAPLHRNGRGRESQKWKLEVKIGS
jgi:hypothetical protein